MGMRKVTGTASQYIYNMLQGLDPDAFVSLPDIRNEVSKYADSEKQVTWYEFWKNDIRIRSFAVIDGGRNKENATHTNNKKD